MDYLEQALGITIQYKTYETAALPYLITERYEIRVARLDDVKALFVLPLAKLDTISAVKKHLTRIQAAENIPTVLVTRDLTTYQRQSLVANKIPFIVEGKQIYLPFMGIFLQEKGTVQPEVPTHLAPSAQLLFLDYLYQRQDSICMSVAAKALGLSAMTASRGAKQLADCGLITVESQGVQRILKGCAEGKALFEKAKPYLSNPVRRKVYVPQSAVSEELPKAGYTALAGRTMLNPPRVSVRASGSASRWNAVSTNTCIDIEKQIELELWRYDPAALAVNGAVDPLSLALSLQDDKDERVEAAVETLLADFWEEYYG